MPAGVTCARLQQPHHLGDGRGATNTIHEPGVSSNDNLHLVTQGSYASPTRRGPTAPAPSTAKARRIGRSGGISAVSVPWDDADHVRQLDNGLAITASNFSGVRGDLLAASFDNTIYDIELNSTVRRRLQHRPVQQRRHTPLDVTVGSARRHDLGGGLASGR
jgi:hypothetical protein